ncbi:arsenic resistance protein, partial [Streptomyces caniscabiei]
QIAVYAAAIGTAAVAGLWLPATAVFAAAINPALALMLFVTFLQVPLTELGQAFGDRRFLAALAVANFVAVPALVAMLVPFLPADATMRLGVLLVLL